METTRLEVRGHGGHYDYLLGEGLLEDEVPRFVRERGFRSCRVVTDERVAGLYGERLASRLPGASLVAFAGGEGNKNLRTLETVCDRLASSGADRGTLVVALGGGIPGDVAGFAAAAFMRGLPFVQVPTTLLAMLDSSVGGKTGVNLASGKNLVGAFKDPLAVFADLSTLDTLSEAEIRNGLAEAVKSALIGDAALFAGFLRGETFAMDEIVGRAVAVKIALVGRDPFERAERAFLNLGHTYGHAIEAASGFRVPHGQAVAVGLVAAARLSAALGVCPPALPGEVASALGRLGLPVGLRGLGASVSPAAVVGAMGADKKREGGTVRFVLLRAPGDPFMADAPSPDELARMLEDA